MLVEVGVKFLFFGTLRIGDIFMIKTGLNKGGLIGLVVIFFDLKFFRLILTFLGKFIDNIFHGYDI